MGMDIERASLIFASISILITSVGSLWLMAYMVKVCILMAKLITLPENMTSYEAKALITNYGLVVNATLAVLVSILIVALAFSIILIRGLLSKNYYLVKGYFIYGVTTNTFSSMFALTAILTFNLKLVSIFLVGCFVYGFVLVMIRNTYLKLAKINKKQCRKKKADEENNTSSEL